MSHYTDHVVLTSPVAVRLTGNASVAGKEDLRSYFRKALEVYSDLRFELLDVMWGISSIVLYYVNQNGRKTGEYMELDANRHVLRVVANYNS